MKGKPVIDSLETIVKGMKEGTYTRSDAAVLITRDAVTQILTFSYPGVDTEDGKKLFAAAAALQGFVPKPKEAGNG